ncbi:MAG TPA: hypothetical protein VN930_01670 [Xanthobacteraceae bacterium]|nr:hypothetical protein [Xanthobacteraceae bacterium]
MAGENVTQVKDPAKAKGAKAEDGDSRQRSSIAFPYEDLTSAVEMAQAINSQVGYSDCDDDQLAAWTEQSPKSSGYRVQISAARLFGVIETVAGHHRLSDLGKMVVDPQRAREAKIRAFLNVPLYNAVYEKYRGGALPPTAALERDIQGLGVAEKIKDRARRVLERSAEQAGFFEQGRGRLVKPGIAVRDEAPPPTSDAGGDADAKKGGSGGGGGVEGLDPFIQGLLRALPPTGSDWNVQDRAKWLQTAANIFDLIYKGEGGIKIDAAMAPRSPRPGDSH